MTDMSTAATKLGIGAIVLVVLATGCGSKSATKAGKTSEPVVLYAAGVIQVPALDYFQQRVLELSKGNLRIEAVDAWDDEKADAEQRMVKYVAGGTADLGWVRTQVFDTLGVPSFQALTAPLLIDSYPLEQAVLDSDIPGRMLPSLDKLQVTPLGIVGDGMRKPIAVKRPLLGLADWRGIGFGVDRSHGLSDAIRALGARPQDVLNWITLPTALSTRQIEAYGLSLRRYAGGWDATAPYVTANVNLWPQVYVLLVNPGRFSKLTDEQQHWLRQAAAEAAARSTRLAQANEISVVSKLCDPARSRFANASSADLAALQAAFAPAVAKLEQDPQTKEFIAQIEKLKRSTAPARTLSIPKRCKATAKTATTAAPTDPSVLNGVYRKSVTVEEFLAVGATPAYAKQSAGVLTTWLKDGHYRGLLHRPDGTTGTCAGPYRVSGDVVTFDLNVPGCSGVVRARWTIRGGYLRLRLLRIEEPGDKLFEKPNKKIG